MQITDGAGTNFAAKVDSENKLMTRAVTESEIQHVNEVEEQVYTAYVALTPDAVDPSVTGTDDLTFFYIKNTNDLNMIIVGIRAWAESSEYIDVHVQPTGTPINTTDVTPFNMNLGSGNTATGDFYKGADIDGMSGGTLVERFRISANDTNQTHIYPSGLIMPKNNILILKAGTGGIPLEVFILFYYH